VDSQAFDIGSFPNALAQGWCHWLWAEGPIIVTKQNGGSDKGKGVTRQSANRIKSDTDSDQPRSRLAAVSPSHRADRARWCVLQQIQWALSVP
jgi:hypothetical protein